MLKLDRIVSVSSEDPLCPAENLLKDEGKNKKWRCKSSGEKNATVVLQLDKASTIKAIDIGNENSAFVEILVGKSCLPDDDYKVLLVASSLMTLKEAKDLTNSNGVRFFKESNFCKPERNEKWDRIKIVCSQPYNKHVQFGLSFIKLHGDDSNPSGIASSSALQPNTDNQVGGLGRFLFKKDTDDDIAVGSIFARRKELLDEEKKTSSVAIRTATSQLLSNDVPSKKNSVKKHADYTNVKRESHKRTKHDVDAGTPKIKKVKKDPLRNSDAGPSIIHQSERIKLHTSSSQQKLCKPFNELMKDVVFTISGFQNPLRSEIRSKALSMGAKYKPDWDRSCSHLICAFSNTPKFNQVKGHGRIVKKEWIEVCYSQRKRIPWRRFALDPPESKKSESEDEICEENNLPSMIDDVEPTQTNGRLKNDQLHIDETTGPSLFGSLVKPTSMRNRHQDNDPKPKLPKKSPKFNLASKRTTEKKVPIVKNELVSGSADSGDNETSLYVDLNLEEVSDLHSDLADTDSDYDWLDKNNTSSFPYLPEQFNDLSFYIADDFPISVKDDLKRYIIAHSGTVIEQCNQDTEFVIAATSSTMLKLKESWPDIVGVKAEWVWRCHDENRLLPTSAFEL